ncbi:uncharacterized protein LOC111678724 [Lucilia cuprina]|uniref:uncharacterized protein LOC111678724 n=1 Tax=Lucilia cuprina TaxID=7375 RepID=UPI001F0648C9|nr:uncharacterized protein LOC111678724 [Lucilia cuprina]
MNTIEESTEISQTQGDQLNGTTSTITTKKITTSSSSSHNSTTPATNGAASPTNGSPNSPTNGLSTSSSDDYLEDLKIIGHLKNIEKLNEKRRIFLSNSLTSEYQSDEKTESQTKKTENGETVGDVHYSAYNEKKTLLQEQKIDNHKSEVETPLLQKYATLPLKTPRSPMTPPPKPPMLSRTRSIGVGDSLSNNSSLKSPPPTPKFAPPPTPTSSFTTATTTTTNIQIQPTTSTIVTTSKLAEPVKVTRIQLNDTDKVDDTMNTESDTVVLRSSLMPENMNGPSNTSSPSSKEISVKHYERLIEELKCPGCAYPMKSPVYLCKTGHSVCDQCTRILLLCPLCKEGFTNIRSLTVEALCSKAHFKCQNASGGCTVRLQIDLLSWHEKQCIYKPMKCFMGRVWGDCQWNGREAFWKDHLDADHSNKVFTKDTVELAWDMTGKQKPLSGYYVFQVYNEMFNFYEVYDKERILFTMTCTSTQKEKKHQFAFEVTLISEDNEALSITQKFPVHSEYDKDILAEGTCISFLLTDLAKFLDEDRLLHYRVRVLEVKSPRRSRALRAISPDNGNHPIDFQLTQIQGVNLKNVPSDVILTRRLDDIPFADNTSMATSTADGTSEDEMDKMKREYYKSLEAKKKRDSGSDTDPEFEAFIAKKWGTPQLHFNRKYLKPNTTSSDGSSSEEHPLSPKSPNDDKISITSVSYKKRVSNTLRKSFRSLKTDLIEMKPFGRKGSPEKRINE